MKILGFILLTGGTFFMLSGIYGRVRARNLKTDPILLGAPRVKYLVIAGSFSEAMAEIDLQRDDWRYVSTGEDLLGYSAGNVEFRLVGRWARSPIFNDAWAFQRLRSLGLYAFPERDATL